jgi:hypothetical protein
METQGDMIVQRLLDDIKSASRQVYFGTEGTFTCFSDGRFLERADSLPLAIDQLRYPFPNTVYRCDQKDDTTRPRQIRRNSHVHGTGWKEI